MKYINCLMLIVLAIGLFSFSASAAEKYDTAYYLADISTFATAAVSISTQNVVTGVILSASDSTAVLEIYDTDVTSTRAAALADAGSPCLVIKCASDEQSIVWNGKLQLTTGMFLYLVDGEAIIYRPTGNY